LQSGSGPDTWNWYGPTDALEGGLVTPGVWQHIAVSHAPGVGRLFVGGILVDQNTDVGNYNQNIFNVGDLTGGGAPWVGRIDDFRVTIGSTVYTSSFLPPTAAFPNS
jgi:hypothetical protein